MSFNINNKLAFIDSFQFLSSSLDSLVKNLGKDYFKNLSQKFDSNILSLAEQKGFYPYEYMSGFEKFDEKLSSKKRFIVFLTSKQISDKDYEHGLKVCNAFEMKTMKDYHNFYLKFDVLILAIFEKLINNNLKNYNFCPSHYLRAPDLCWNA